MARQPSTLTPAAWELGTQLKTQRTETGKSAAALAVLVGRSQAQLTRWETGLVIPTVDDLRSFCDALGIGEQRHDYLRTLADRARQAGTAVRTTGDGTSTQFVAFEAEAARIIHVSPLLIPGVLQTEDYARDIMRGVDLASSEVERRVQARLARREALLRDGTQFEAIVAERVLTEGPCSREVLRAQLKYLLELAEDEAITLRMVTMDGRSVAMFDGAFTIMWFGERMAPIGHVEVRNYATVITSPRVVGSLNRDANVCRDNAATHEDTVRILAGLIAE